MTLAATKRVGKLRGLMRGSVSRNAGSLYLMQIGKFLLQLVSSPYLLRVLGPASIGRVAFAQGTVATLSILVEFGFNWSVAREVALHREEPERLNRIASTVWMAKLLLYAVTCVLLLLLCLALPGFRREIPLLVILQIGAFSWVLMPVWLFQGLERIHYISNSLLVMRIATTLLIVTLIHQPNHTMLYAAILSLGTLFAAFYTFHLAFRIAKIRLVRPTWIDLRQAVEAAWRIFLSVTSVQFYASFNVVLLGLLTNPVIVGYYSVGERLILAATELVDPVLQAAYPRSSMLAASSRDTALYWCRRMLLGMIALGSFIACGLLLAAPLAVHLYAGGKYAAAIPVLRILAILPLAKAISNVLGIQVMLPFKQDRAFLAILASAGLIDLMLALPLVSLWHASGMAASVALTETYVVVAMFGYLWHAGLNPLARRNGSGLNP